MNPRRFDIPCRIAIEQSDEHFHAHVELDGDVPIFPGDSVQVHGEPIHIRFGEQASYERIATVTRAHALTRAWIRCKAYFDFGELYEVSFTPGSLR